MLRCTVLNVEIAIFWRLFCAMFLELFLLMISRVPLTNYSPFVLHFISLISIFRKIEKSRFMESPCCLYVCVFTTLAIECLNQSL
jgi:hypothetical protein